MKDFDIEDALRIIQNCDENSIKDTRHFRFRNVQRNYDSDLIYQTLLFKPIVGILKQDYNKFKIYYEHEIKISEDIILIIAIEENNLINLITTFSTSKQQRLRKYGI